MERIRIREDTLELGRDLASKLGLSLEETMRLACERLLDEYARRGLDVGDDAGERLADRLAEEIRASWGGQP